jgi:DNA-directed RNA polymerase specialized sigma24 family protein
MYHLLAFPCRGVGHTLHARLVVQDATAPADVCAAYVEPLEEWLIERNGGIDEHLCRTAAADAILDYVQNPHRYDPSKSDLASYLRMAAQRDLYNLLRGERSRRRGQIPWPAVELGLEEGNIQGREEGPLAELERGEEQAGWLDFLRRVRERLSPPEREVLDLLLDGERDTCAYAAVLGLADWPREEQEREVKRVKDRIKKRLEREPDCHA